MDLKESKNFFDTVAFTDAGSKIYKFMQEHDINIRKVDSNTSSISMDETVAHHDLRNLITMLGKAVGVNASSIISSLETKDRSINVI